MQSGKEVDDVHQHEIEERDVTAEQQHGNDHHGGRIEQFLITAESFFLGVPRPRSLSAARLFTSFKKFFVFVIMCVEGLKRWRVEAVSFCRFNDSTL